MARKSTITITWNPDYHDYAKVTRSEAWENMEYIYKLDCLQDAIHDLTKLYNQLIADEQK